MTETLNLTDRNAYSRFQTWIVYSDFPWFRIDAKIISSLLTVDVRMSKTTEKYYEFI